MTTLFAYTPAVLYLASVCTVLLLIKRVPIFMHAVALAAGTTVAVMCQGWVATAVTTGAAVAVFLVLALLAGATVTGVTLFTLATALAITPLAGWPGLGAGLLAAAAVSLWRTWHHLGKERVMWLAMDTMNAVGVSTTGALKMPELDLIPDRTVLTNVETRSPEAARVRMYLPPYLLGGAGLAVAVAALIG